MKKFLAALAITSCLVPVSASANEIFRTSALDPVEGLDSGGISEFENAFIAYDNFILDEAATVTGAQWWGNNTDIDGSGDFEPDSFEIFFLTDDGGLPEMQIGDSFFAPDLTVSSTPTGLFDESGTEIISYEASFDGPTLAADTDYWFGVQNDLFTGDQWVWARSASPGSYALEDEFAQTVSPVGDTDLAFVLFGDPVDVSEPSALGLLGLGLAGLAVARRRAK